MRLTRKSFSVLPPHIGGGPGAARCCDGCACWSDGALTSVGECAVTLRRTNSAAAEMFIDGGLRYLRGHGNLTHHAEPLRREQRRPISMSCFVFEMTSSWMYWPCCDPVFTPWMSSQCPILPVDIVRTCPYVDSGIGQLSGEAWAVPVCLILESGHVGLPCASSVGPESDECEIRAFVSVQFLLGLWIPMAIIALSPLL